MSVSGQNRILTAHSCAVDPRQAVREFYAAVAQPDMALAIFFCSSEYDLNAVAEEMDRLFAGVPVVGCTTAGEIGAAGYQGHSISGASFPAADFVAVSGHIDELQQFDVTRGHAFAQNLRQKLERMAPGVKPGNSFALLLIDGLSVREEPVTWSLQNTLGEVPLVGGSAGDGLNFRSTHVFSEGRFHRDSAVLVLVSTTLPFRIFKTQHFVPTDRKAVATAADPAHRIVTEIDGWPAAEGYARLLGIEAQDLGPQNFADAPVCVQIDGTNYVRSIQKVNSDGSLTFYCAIEEGLVLRLARGVDLVENLERTFADIRTEIGQPQLVIGFDCILRKLEIVDRGLAQQVGDVFRRNNLIGLNTYGEQFRYVHINQTLTGIAIGDAAIADG